MPKPPAAARAPNINSKRRRQTEICRPQQSYGDLAHLPAHSNHLEYRLVNGVKSNGMRVFRPNHPNKFEIAHRGIGGQGCKAPSPRHYKSLAQLSANSMREA